MSKSSFHFWRKDIVSIDIEDKAGMVNTMDIMDCMIILIIKFLWNQPQQSINQKGVIYCIHSSSEAPVYTVEWVVLTFFYPIFKNPISKPNHCERITFLFPKMIQPVIMILFTTLVAKTATNPIVNITEATAVAKFEIPGKKIK